MRGEIYIFQGHVVRLVEEKCMCQDVEVVIPKASSPLKRGERVFAEDKDLFLVEDWCELTGDTVIDCSHLLEGEDDV